MLAHAWQLGEACNGLHSRYVTIVTGLGLCIACSASFCKNIFASTSPCTHCAFVKYGCLGCIQQGAALPQGQQAHGATAGAAPRAGNKVHVGVWR